ncbi:hypothetical protein [Arthrobacter sp. CAN_C5]|uniref:hypothetical protein n=1 Tax=Arthrobacter sp. CAN_C5 TaxID=2760706 RepID=UPI0028A60098|nr:hypothetical protein [Arthrobacter sp. CAN_C5]MBP2217193.1 hypothetical protein [Arthrobacter sp. CAN_C5]
MAATLKHLSASHGGPSPGVGSGAVGSGAAVVDAVADDGVGWDEADDWGPPVAVVGPCPSGVGFCPAAEQLLSSPIASAAPAKLVKVARTADPLVDVPP